AGDVSQAFDGHGFKQLENRLDVDARRLEKVHSARRPGPLENLADQGIAVGMRAARGKPEDHVAGPDRAPVDNAVLFHHAEREAGEIVFVPGERVRMLGRLAADQRTAGQLAARSDTLDDLRRNTHIELFADVVVEEEQRFGPANENVVYAHRNEIDAHRVVPLQFEGELEFGADAVGPRHEHRLAVFLRDLAQRAETAYASEHLGPQRAPGERLDRLDQRIAGLDVDAGVAV